MVLENPLTPTLRFPEFNEEWKNTTLGQESKFSKGKGISKNDIDPQGNLFCIRYGELYTDYETIIDEPLSRTFSNADDLILSEGGEVIVPASGEDAKDIARASVILRKGVAIGGDLNIIKSTNNGAFLASYLSGKKRLELARMAQGNSVVHLYSTQLGSLKIHLPTLPEQQKIADFLTAVDARIAHLQQKHSLLQTYKKGLMQQLFSQALRFTQPNGSPYPDWEEKRLGEVATFFSGGTPSSSNTEYYSGNIPFIGSGNINAEKVEQFISEIALKNSSAKLVSKGDLLYALYGATSGEVAISKINGAINQAVLCIRTNHNVVYLYNFLTHKKQKITSTYLQGGQGNLSAQIIKDLTIPLPHTEEQQKIAAFLTAVDAKISLTAQAIQHVKAFKKGLLQQMFV